MMLNLWILVGDKCMPRQILTYSDWRNLPDNECDYTTINHIVAGVDDILRKHLRASLILMGDLVRRPTHSRQYWTRYSLIWELVL